MTRRFAGTRPPVLLCCLAALLAGVLFAGADMLSSTFLGGTGNDQMRAVAVAVDGSIYVCGWTESTNFPATAGAYQTSRGGGRDACVCRFDAAMTNLQACTYLGGTGDDRAFALAVDGAGNVYVAGETKSTNFPTAGAYDAAYSATNGATDGFVAVLDANLAVLVAGTYLGGTNADYVYAIGLDAQTNVYVCGGTESADFPTAGAAPYDASYNGAGDCFAARLSRDLSSLAAATFLGGSAIERNPVLVVGNGSLYVAGSTKSANFPVGNGLDHTYGGGYDVFVSRLSADLSTMQASTYLGGSTNDEVYAFAANSAGRYFVGGRTASTNFPTTPSALIGTKASSQAGFIACLDAAVSNLLASTLVDDPAGSGTHLVGALAVAGTGTVYAAGNSTSASLPTVPGAYDRTYNGLRDIVVLRIRAGLDAMTGLTYVGGDAPDDVYALAVDARTNVIFAGETVSAHYPTVRAVDPSFGGGFDGYASMLDAALSHWWYRYGVVDGGETANDYAAANAGQLKWIASRAYAAMEEKLAGGAGGDLDSYVPGLPAGTNFVAVNVGQVKEVARRFYTRLGLATPWTGAAQTNDYATANVGQVKNVFSFTISN